MTMIGMGPVFEPKIDVESLGVIEQGTVVVCRVDPTLARAMGQAEMARMMEGLTRQIGQTAGHDKFLLLCCEGTTELRKLTPDQMNDDVRAMTTKLRKRLRKAGDQHADPKRPGADR